MQKEKKTEITKDKLLKATEKLMEGADDPFKITSRQIASEAGMQAAMINYCFGSREKLIYEVFQRKYKETLKNNKIERIIASDLSPKEKLKKLHFIVAGFLIKEYQITKAITNLVLFERDLSVDSFSFAYVKEHFKGKKTDAECRLIAYELSTMMQLIIFRKNDFRDHMGIDLSKPGQLKHYIEMRIDLLLPEE